MLKIEWNSLDGWQAPQILPYQNISLDPTACVFQYASECFEGMKAYRDKTGKVRLFRPDMNMKRFNQSAARIALPNFDVCALIDLISFFVQLEERFVPDRRGYSLYLRPTMIGTSGTLGLGAPTSALLYVIACPVGPYYPTGFKAISLEATSSAIRAWPGGVGDKKLGANYAPCIVPQMKAVKSGHQQILWLFGDEGFITEVGTMNIFMAIESKDGQKELVTAPLDGMILAGVTRNSVLALAREKMISQGWQVSERKCTITELWKASEEGRLLEVFGSGTAAIISPIRSISWNSKILNCGLKQNQEAGEVAHKMKTWIEARQYGDENHEWSHLIS